MFENFEEIETKMIHGPDLTIALTVTNRSLMRTQITSSRRYVRQNDFKLIVSLLTPEQVIAFLVNNRIAILCQNCSCEHEFE
jgi:hypothetical protein